MNQIIRQKRSLLIAQDAQGQAWISVISLAEFLGIDAHILMIKHLINKTTRFKKVRVDGKLKNIIACPLGVGSSIILDLGPLMGGRVVF